MSQTYPHYDAFNALFNAPPQEALRLSSEEVTLVSTPDYETGLLTLDITHRLWLRPVQIVIACKGETLELSLGEFDIEATNWRDLGNKVLMHPPSTLNAELAALFLQVGGDTQLADHFMVPQPYVQGMLT